MDKKLWRWPKTAKFSQVLPGLSKTRLVANKKKWSCQCGPRQPSYEAKFGTSTTWQRRASAPAREMHVATSLGKQTRLRHTPWYAILHRIAAPQSSIYQQPVKWLNCYSRIFSYEHYLELNLTTCYFWRWNMVALNVWNNHYFYGQFPIGIAIHQSSFRTHPAQYLQVMLFSLLPSRTIHNYFQLRLGESPKDEKSNDKSIRKTRSQPLFHSQCICLSRF